MVDQAGMEMTYEVELEEKLRLELECEYANKLAVARNIACEQIPYGVEMDYLESLDQNIPDDEAQMIEHHRVRADVSFFLEDMDRTVDSLNQILAVLPHDLDAINRLGHTFDVCGKPASAESQYRRLLEIAPDDERVLAAAYGNLGTVLRMNGDLGKAGVMHRMSLVINEQLYNQAGVAANYCNLGLVLGARHELDNAEVMQRKSLAINEQLGNQNGVSANYNNLGLINRARGELDNAEEMHRKSLAIADELGSQRASARQYCNLALIYRSRGDLVKAEEMHLTSLAIFEELGSHEGMAATYGNLGAVAKARGKLADTRRLWVKSRDIYTEMNAQHLVDKAQMRIDELSPE